VNTGTKKRIGWTKLERIERTGHWFHVVQAGFEAECYLCRKTIPELERHAHGKVQARAYRSSRDIGDTRMEIRVCARCIFPV
jgi:hypothetical protein